MRGFDIPRLLRYLLCVIFLVSLMTGCKTKTIGRVDSAGVKAHDEFFRSAMDRSFAFTTMTARLNVELDIPGKEMSSRVDMKMVKDSAFQLSVQPLLGIEIFRLELTRDTIKIVDRLNKRYMVENYSNLQGQTPIEFNFYNLQALFINHLFLPGESEVRERHYRRFKLNQDGLQAKISVRDVMGLLYAFSMDGDQKLLSTIVSGPSGSYGLNWNYDNFRLVGDQPFPMLMDVSLNKAGNTIGGVKIHYSRIKLDEPIKLDFSIPSKYKRVKFAQLVKSIINLNR